MTVLSSCTLLSAFFMSSILFHSCTSFSWSFRTTNSINSISSKIATPSPFLGMSQPRRNLYCQSKQNHFMSKSDNNEKPVLSVAILGGGITGLSCASNLLKYHKQQQQQQQENGESLYHLEINLFDTGRLRPGGRCSSRLPGDVPPVVKNRSSGQTPVRRACDSQNDDGNNRDNGDDGGKGDDGDDGVPNHIRRILAEQSTSSSRDRIVSSLGPVDHAAQILSVPAGVGALGSSDCYKEFQSQLQQWVDDGVIASFPEGSVAELSESSEKFLNLKSVHGDMYYGIGGMGSIPISMRDYCLSVNEYGNGRSFKIWQDVWVSPSNGVKFIGDPSNGGRDISPQWELRAGPKSLGKYHRLVIAHNGKCADRIMSRTPATRLHSLLKTRFAPYVPQRGGKEMTLNSIYSLVFVTKAGSGERSPLSAALTKLSGEGKDHDTASPYTIMVKNEPNLRLLSNNSQKHKHDSNNNMEVWTLLSSAQFGKKFKGPQENLPEKLMVEVTMELFSSLERSLQLNKGEVTDSIVDLRLQLWGAAVPMNRWESNSSSSEDGGDGFVYDATFGVGACGDWILDPSIAGAWESGRRLAQWMIQCHSSAMDEPENAEQWSVGLPDSPTDHGKGGKFVPSRAALESGIGTVPSSPDAVPAASFSEDKFSGQSSRSGGGRGGRGRGRGRGGRGGKGGRSGRGGGNNRWRDDNARAANGSAQNGRGNGRTKIEAR